MGFLSQKRDRMGLFAGAFSRSIANRDIFGPSSPAGTLAATEAQDIAAMAGNAATAGVTGSLSATETQDLAVAAGAQRQLGTLTATEAQDSASLAGQKRYVGTLAATEQQDGLSASGASRISGALNASEAQDVIVIAGAMRIVGALSAIDAQDTGTASGSVTAGSTIFAVMTALEASDGCSIGGRSKAKPQRAAFRGYSQIRRLPRQQVRTF